TACGGMSADIRVTRTRPPNPPDAFARAAKTSDSVSDAGSIHTASEPASAGEACSASAVEQVNGAPETCAPSTIAPRMSAPSPVAAQVTVRFVPLNAAAGSYVVLSVSSAAGAFAPSNDSDVSCCDRTAGSLGYSAQSATRAWPFHTTV